MLNRYILAIDQGTTSSRAILFDHDGAIVGAGVVTTVGLNVVFVKFAVGPVVGTAVARYGSKVGDCVVIIVGLSVVIDNDGSIVGGIVGHIVGELVELLIGGAVEGNDVEGECR